MPEQPDRIMGRPLTPSPPEQIDLSHTLDRYPILKFVQILECVDFLDGLGICPVGLSYAGPTHLVARH